MFWQGPNESLLSEKDRVNKLSVQKEKLKPNYSIVFFTSDRKEMCTYKLYK